MTISQNEALENLRVAVQLLKAAYAATELAEPGLMYGARISRCQQLREKIADTIAFSERLAFVTLGDVHADGAR